MRYRESAIAVLVAVMLGLASLFGGFTLEPALAIDDPNAVQIAKQTITQDNDESTIIDAFEVNAKKSTSRASGTVTIEIIQNEDILRTATFKTSSLSSTAFTSLEVQVTNIDLKGSFEIVLQYVGSGLVTVSEIKVLEGTEAAEQNPDSGDGIDDGPTDQTVQPQQPEQPQQELENVIASKTMSLGDEESMTIDTVEFDAMKSSTRAKGALTVGIVQDGEVLGEYRLTTSVLSSITITHMQATFDDLEVTDDFKVVFIYEGSGLVTIKNISVPGATEIAAPPAEGPGDDVGSGSGPSPSGTFKLVVNANDQNGNKLTGLSVALLNGNNQFIVRGFTEFNATFTLEAGKSYAVEMTGYYNEDTKTFYEFKGWQDSTNDNTRRPIDLTKFGEDKAETFTAEYTVTENAPPPQDNGGEITTSPPLDSPAGTITVYAYRIPHEKWGTSTFVDANANMYFVVYNSTGWIIYSDYADESGHTINGLNESETYWIYPTDCDECHNDPHDVLFDHWENGSTDRPRAVTTGHSVGAYYAYDPDP
jgi:hypothetical protein